MGDFWDGVMPKDVILYEAADLAEDATGEAVAGFARHKYVQFVLDVTAAEGATAADKLDVLIDRAVTADGPWVNVAHFPQVAGNAADKTYVMALDRETADSTPLADSLDYTADLAANISRPLVLGAYLRVRADVTIDANPAAEWAFSVAAHGE